MAGDWIKFEVATLHKPEVTLAAEYLGISRRETLGILLDYWAWLDANSRDAVVTHVSRKSLEDVLSVVGFAAILEMIGWAKFDDAKHTMTVINYDNHNGNSAKTRGLAQKRMSRKRDAVVTLKSEPEKRREDINTSTPAPKSRRKPQTQVPDDFAVSVGVEKWATANGHTRLQAHLENFKFACASKGYVYSDHDAAFKKAIRDDWAKLGAAGKAPRMTVLPDLPRRDGDIPDAALAVIAKLRAHG